MNWTEILKFLGGSTVVLAAVGFVVKSIATHFLNRDLESLKGEIKNDSDRELQAFRGTQEKHLQDLRAAQEKQLQQMREAQESRMNELRRHHELDLQGLQAGANERIELVRSTLQRVERLEGELLKSRDDAYGEIWTISECVNLFGPTQPVDCAAISQSLTRWYFTKGRLLTPECLRVYFLIQELLNFFHVRSVAPARPSEQVLFTSSKAPVEVVIGLQTERLGIPFKGDMGKYEDSELFGYVSGFKTKYASAGEKLSAEDAWLLIHFMMSLFRSRLVIERGWRNPVQSSPLAEKDQPRPGAAGNGGPVVSSSGVQHTR